MHFELSVDFYPSLKECQKILDYVNLWVLKQFKKFIYKRTIEIDVNIQHTIFSEADVNTATPSLSNAAATWAGWAVTAVTAKFYRSQSDTPKSSNAHNTSRILLNKPASLGI